LPNETSYQPSYEKGVGGGLGESFEETGVEMPEKIPDISLREAPLNAKVLEAMAIGNKQTLATTVCFSLVHLGDLKFLTSRTH